jgi:hypothetical protein
MDVLPRPGEQPTRPQPLSAEDVARYVVAAAIWAPSVHNTQPWRFGLGEQGLSLHADGSRQLITADPGAREMMISCGAALFTARLALRSLGYIPVARVCPDPAQPLLVARLSWDQRAAPTEYEQQLFSQVRQRRTHRGGFDPLPLSPQLLAVLQDGAGRDGAMLRVIADEASRAVLAEVVQAAERVLRLDSAHARELAAWTPPPGSPRRDGVPDTSYPSCPERTQPYFPGRDFGRGHRWGLPRLSPAPARSAGVVCLLTTADDRPRDWVHAGQALQRVLLTSATCGVAAALHSQPLELAALREFIRTQLSGGAYPQLVLRLGTVIQVAASVRRPPASVLFSGGEHRGISDD